MIQADLPVGSDIVFDCPFLEDITVVSTQGHMHEYGTYFKVDGTKPMVVLKRYMVDGTSLRTIHIFVHMNLDLQGKQRITDNVL